MLQITQIIKRSEQGMTAPFLCKASDERLYWVKGKDTGKFGLCSELIAGKIGKAFGLPIPDFKLVEVCNELINESEIDGIATKLGSGIWSASTNVKLVDDLKYSNIAKVDINLRIKILAFDWWVKNCDRTLGPLGGNVNLLWNSKLHDLYVIDHNLAFDDKFIFSDFKKNHVFNNDFIITNDLADKLYNKMYDIIKHLEEFFLYFPDLWLV